MSLCMEFCRDFAAIVIFSWPCGNLPDCLWSFTWDWHEGCRKQKSQVKLHPGWVHKTAVPGSAAAVLCSATGRVLCTSWVTSRTTGRPQAGKWIRHASFNSHLLYMKTSCFAKCLPTIVPGKGCGGEHFLPGYTTLTTLSQTRGSSNSAQWQMSITGPFLRCSHLALRLQNGPIVPPKQLHQFKRDFQDSTDIFARLWREIWECWLPNPSPPQELHLLPSCHLSPSS